MKQRLLQHLSLAKPLRLALVLFTLLLTLPQMAWGQTVTTYTFDQTATDNGNGTYSISSNSGAYSWTIQDLASGHTPVTNALGFSDVPAGGNLLFTIYSDFTLTGAFVSAKITYSTSNTSKQSVAIYKNTGSLNDALTYGNSTTQELVELTGSPQTISLGSTQHDHQFFAGNRIAFYFSIEGSTTSGNGTISIQSIEITTTPISYGISVAGTPVTKDNASGITGTGISGTVKYTHNNDGTGTLTLNGASLTDKIRISRAEALTIELIGANSIHPTDSSAIKADFGTGTAPTSSPSLIFKGEGHVTLTPGSTYPAIGGLNVDLDTYGMYADGSLTTNGTPVIVAKKYDITVAGAPVTSFNATATTGIAAGNGKVYYDATNNILTLDGAEVDGMIKTELENLTIKLKGNNNTITTNNSNNGIYSDKNTGTLTFTKEGANASLTIASNVSVIRGFASLGLENSGLYTNTSTPYKIKSDSSYPRLADATTSDTDTTAIKSITISDVATYQLWVAGNQVTGAANVTGTGIAGTVSFNASNSILTLNAATITGIIVSSLGDLTIHLTGGNTIQATGTETSLINSTNAGTLTFETDATTGNYLYFRKSNGTDYYTAIPISGFTVAYEAGLGYNSQFSQIIGSLSIMYNSNTYKLHSSNANDIVGEGKASFSYDSTNGNVLTLNNANIEDIEWGIDNDLTIALNGTCSVIRSGTYVINSTGGGKIVFVKANGASNAELTLKSGDGATMTISAPDSILGSGLYWKNIAVNHLVITEDPNFVIINDYVMTDTRTINGTTAGTITYNSTDKVLTLNGFQNNFGAKHAIKTGVKDLKVKLIGESTINCAADSAIFHAFSNSASIQFVKNDDTSKLTMTGTAFDKFAADNITYNGLVYYSANKYIAIPTAPTMDVDIDNKVVLTADYEGGTIAYKYSIDYADETADVTDATYSAPFEMAAPGTVTAWVEANGTTTSTVKGKKFGYQGAPFSMMVNDVKTPVLIPAIEAGDDIVYDSSTPYASNDASVATFENGNITAHAIGTATLTTRLGYNTNNVPATKLLNYDSQFTTQLTVSKVFNIAFAEGANYMTYYNIDAEDLTIPDGMTAAIVTGVASSGTTVETTALSYIPGRTAILLGKGTSTGTPSVTKYIGKDPAPTGNKLKYVEITPQTTTGYEYVLYKDEFVKATGSIPDGKCYLDLTGAAPAPAPARSLGIDSDGTTDIHLVNSEEGIANREVWYDLQGRRIEQPTKAGLYIKNGKKVIVNTK